MKTNKIQFQAGMSLNQLLSQYGTAQQCEEAIENARWLQGFKCPKYLSSEYYHYRRQGGVKIFQCRTQTTLTEGTIFHSTKLPLTIWF